MNFLEGVILVVVLAAGVALGWGSKRLQVDREVKTLHTQIEARTQDIADRDTRIREQNRSIAALAQVTDVARRASSAAVAIAKQAAAAQKPANDALLRAATAPAPGLTCLDADREVYGP